MTSGKVLFCLFALVSIAASVAKAEAPAQPNNGSAQPQGKSLNRTINIFDDGVFGLGKDSGNSTTSPTGRTLSNDADYNTEQRERWLKKCAPLREKDLRKYQDCYRNEKDSELSNVQRRINEQEASQSEPLRNTGPGKESSEVPPLLPDVDERESSDEE